MYSTADIAKRLGCTVQAVNKYRRKVEKQIGRRFGTPDPSDGRRTLYSEDEVSQIAEMAPKIPVTEITEEDSIEVELIDGPDTQTVIAPTRSSLALRHASLPAAERLQFNLVDAAQTTADVEAHTARTAQRADSLLSDFAVTEMLGAVADIQQTVATMKANAMGDATAALGKHTGKKLETSG
ncbi:hypothetical protein PN498_17745 [Oscillatoria sp. CS-180]|uniref:hypothetical protein n=1 Tax=Oscillatoria sp. CS-180 TaxID=3021720 RepID=UPI00232F6418|nr:hypothetical protein [Oscillatoria sp. CS-180]MDB9527843.1 hypothetical protein [Oscillatoria sp. CS-180]